MEKALENHSRRRRGRPNRREASEAALANVDLSKLDPLDVLRAIAADTSAPASARVTAAKALMEDELRRELEKANAWAMPRAADES
jgi:hypothetical protein